MKFSNKTYDILKYIAQIVLPALGTLYFALASIWGLPYGEQIVGTITAIDPTMKVTIAHDMPRWAVKSKQKNVR